MIPKIDSFVGISVYCTSSQGFPGKIKNSPEDFIVSEVLSEKKFSKIQRTKDSEKDMYQVFSLKKEGIDTNHALEKISKKYGMRLKALGLKDAKAKTEQFVVSLKKSNKFPSDNITEEKFSLSPVGFVDLPLSKKDMIGNKFQIKIVPLNTEPSAPQIKKIDFDPNEKILNFFGYQRFGSHRPVTHLIGKALLQGDYEKVVKIMTCFPADFNFEKNIESELEKIDFSNLKQINENLPSHLDYEKRVLQELLNEQNYQKALRVLPIDLRRFYTQAYQSFIFNRTLSEAFENDENLFEPKNGDVVFDKQNKIKKYDGLPSEKLAVPLVGFSYYKKTRFDFYISKILAEEELNMKDFYLKEMQEISVEGGFRNSQIHFEGLKIQDDWIEFVLPRGCYATIILREILKPHDPITAGF